MLHQMYKIFRDKYSNNDMNLYDKYEKILKLILPNISF